MANLQENINEILVELMTESAEWQDIAEPQDLWNDVAVFHNSRTDQVVTISRSTGNLYVDTGVQ